MDLNLCVQEIEEQMRVLLTSPSPALEPFYGMMAYHLGWLDRDFQPVQAGGGKRFRPLLCLLTCAALGMDYHRALPAAAAVELVHNFSLIHDDIEDASRMRRHRETVWAIWGIPQGINTGDSLLALAHLALRPLLEHGIEPARVLEIAHILDITCLQLCEGQFLDLSFEERLDITIEEYLTMIGHKSAALIAAATEIGAFLAANDRQVVESYHRFGWEMGLAFQMVDDILDIWGDPEITGKPAANDILAKKKTLPIVYALAELKKGGADQTAKAEMLRRIYQQTQISGSDVAVALGLLEMTGARAFVQAQAEEHTARALAALDQVGLDNPAQDQLREIASSSLKRAA